MQRGFKIPLEPRKGVQRGRGGGGGRLRATHVPHLATRCTAPRHATPRQRTTPLRSAQVANRNLIATLPPPHHPPPQPAPVAPVARLLQPGKEEGRRRVGNFPALIRAPNEKCHRRTVSCRPGTAPCCGSGGGTAGPERWNCPCFATGWNRPTRIWRERPRLPACQGRLHRPASRKPQAKWRSRGIPGANGTAPLIARSWRFLRDNFIVAAPACRCSTVARKWRERLTGRRASAKCFNLHHQCLDSASQGRVPKGRFGAAGHVPPGRQAGQQCSRPAAFDSATVQSASRIPHQTRVGNATQCGWAGREGKLFLSSIPFRSLEVVSPTASKPRFPWSK